MSSINTNGIDVNYPVPGQNNSSQGFRNNFAAIKTNLDTAGDELSDLQNKVVVKTALNNTTINNDMANTLISNASTRSFRATTYNLGNALSGTVLVDVSLGDVQYGTIAGDVSLQFGSWAPYGTQSNVQLQFNISNSDAKITFPSQVVYSNNNFGLTTLENYGGDAGEGNVTIPYGLSQVNYTLSTLDCGNTILITPVNRPRQTTQIQQRNPSPKGFQGDVIGTTCVDSGATQFTITGANTDPYLTTSGNTTTLGLFTDMPIVFTGTSLEANIVVGNTYYVRNVISSTQFTVSSTIGGANVAIGANATGTTMFANPVQYMYIATQDYNSTEYTKTVSQTIPSITLSGVSISNTAGGFTCTASSETLVINQPVVISGTLSGSGTITGYSNPTTYFIINTNGSTNFQLSATLGGANVTTTAGTTTGLTFTVNTNVIVVDNTTSLITNSPVIFTGETDVANTKIIEGEVYYIKTIPDGTSLTVSRSRTNGIAGSTVTLGTWSAGNAFSATSYVGADIWKRIQLNNW